MSTILPNTLSKAEKLKSRKQIELLFAQGKGFTAFPVKVVYKIVDREPLNADDSEMAAEKLESPSTLLPTTNQQLAAVQIGVTASTRNFKHAADRNRIKRLLREAYRQQKHELTAVATQKGLHISVFFIYLDKTLPTYELVFDKMRYCLKRLRKMLEEQP